MGTMNRGALLGAALMLSMGGGGPQPQHFPNRSRYAKGSKCQRVYDRKAARAKGKAARHARVARSQRARGA